MRSSNTDFLKKEAKRLNQVVIETGTEVDTGSDNSFDVDEQENSKKRKRIPKKQWSDLIPLAKQPKIIKPSSIKATKKSRTSSGKAQEISSDSSISSPSDSTDDELTGEKDEFSVRKSQFIKEKENNKFQVETRTNAEVRPSIEELKQMLEHYKSLVANCSDRLPNSLDNNDSKKFDISGKISSTKDIRQDKHINDSDDDQLLGPDFIGDNMVNIGNNVFCKNKILKSAVGSSHKATHLARRLLEGVFKHEALMSCTMSGQAPRAQGKERQTAEVFCLNERAKQAIIDFALGKATDKGWIEQTKAEIKREMGQKLGEYKREHKNKI